ncbi:hypothetical protein KVR01_008705 [Diaporthe batatas]|uniref:uncharacterized protein n=1 Tax=Diaporthe batatas TaxID=748121 RepID=UPI001D04C3C8|nr:uncharacterized protein KVR01_008705 [Diaporthe batatas]KAG8161718.1 hypothetical protein KVR01_008705 [Diaporthe batatas]
MEGMNNQKLSSEAMLAEARAFQKEVTRGQGHRGSHPGPSSQRSAAYGPGARAAAGTPRGFSRQPVSQQNLATPEQFFGRQGRPPPAAPQNPTMPATPQPVSRPVDNYEPMQVDPNPAAPHDHNGASPTTGRGLVGSRWATSAPPNMPPPHMTPPITAPVAPATASIDGGRAGATMNKAPTLPFSSQRTTLDTPEMPKASKGLLGSKWAATTSPASPSATNTQYPDPSTLEPVYRSEDWLSDLSAEYKESSINTRNASENQPIRKAPLTQPNAAKTAAETAKPPTSEPQQPAQNPSNFSAASQNTTTRTFAPQKVAGTNSGPSSEFGRPSPSAQSASTQSAIFNDSAFKDWYNTQFMRPKAK